MTFQRVLVVAALLLGMEGNPLHAQLVSALPPLPASVVETQGEAPLDRLARLTISEVSLLEALDQLQRSSGVALAYSRTLLPLMQEVSCDCSGSRVADALDHLLKGTGLTYMVLDQQVVIAPAPYAPPAAVAPEPVFASVRAASPPVFAVASRPRNVADRVAGTITGRIVETGSQRPLSGVQVSVPGTGRGSLTNSEGRFVILNVAAGQVQLRAELIGYGTVNQTITVRDGETTTVDLTMGQEALALDAIVVTGTAGAARRREVGNSISQVTMAEGIDRPVNMDAALQARVPGMTVMASSGQLGSASQIRLRGNTSVAMSNQPLIYIDGVRVRSQPYPKNGSGGESSNRSNNDVQSPLNDISPSDIERMEVIKGAAATTLYGTEAAAGVIQIFTKRGKTGAAKWNLDIDQSISHENAFAPEPQPFIYLEPWLKNAHSQKYAMSVSGGSEALTYFVSGSVEDNKGVLPKDMQSKYGLRANLNFSPLPDMQVQFNTMYANSETQNTPTGNNSHGLLLNVYRQEQNYVGGPEKSRIDKVLDYEIISRIDRMNMGATVSYTPFSALSNRLIVGYDLAHNELRQLRPYGFIMQPEGRLSNRQFRTGLLTLDYVSSLNMDLAGSLKGTFSVGGQSATNNEVTVDGYSTTFPGPSQPTLSTGALRQSFEDRVRVVTGGFFGQGLFAFKDRYFFTAGVRVDGSSAFGEAFGWQVYPKASLSYVISEESFWPKYLGQTKLRAAYGHAGRAPGAFDAIRTWTPAGWGGLPAYLPGNVGNANLGPERTAELELGFETALFDQRLTIDFTRYSQKVSDALFSVRQIPSLGFQSSQLANVGELENKGMEIVLTGIPVRNETVTWELGTSIATNHSKTLSLGGAASFSVGGSGWIAEGQPVPAIKGTRVTNPREVADPIKEVDVWLGPNQPTLILGINTSLYLPWDITVSARGEYQGGNWIEDSASSNAQQRGIASWPTCLNALALIKAGQSNQLTAIERQRCIVANYLPRTFLYPADFFKLRDVSVRLPIPVKIPRSQSAWVTVSARNAWRWLNKDFPIFDPEMMANDGALSSVRAMNEQYPQPATYTASIRVVF
jgi:TonB-dependent starch-binding outer membrane protein SusC